jgi:dipeptidyl aminopeptidase/acylaminoacyl peptidase
VKHETVAEYRACYCRRSLCVACHLRVDETARQIWFVSGGTHRGKDPYFASFYRINFDGTGLVELTTTDANHNGSYSTDGQLFVDNYSRVDLAPVLELRKTTDNSIVATVEGGDSTELAKTGWQPPEVFTAKGRDGKTDIWGVIIRPANSGWAGPSARNIQPRQTSIMHIGCRVTCC